MEISNQKEHNSPQPIKPEVNANRIVDANALVLTNRLVSIGFDGLVPK